MFIVLTSVFTLAGDAYRYTIQPVYDNLTDAVTCHIRRRRPSSPVLFSLFHFVEVTSRGFRSPVVRRRVLADAVSSTDGNRRGSVVADFIGVEFDVGVHLADEFLLRATDITAAQTVGGDQTVTGTLWNMPDTHSRGSTTRFRVHEIAQSSAFVASVRPRRPFDVSTGRWRRPAHGAADAGAASCDMNPLKFLPADDDDDDDEGTPNGRQTQTVKAVIQRKRALVKTFRYYIMSAESPPYFRFTIPGAYAKRQQQS